MRSWRIWWGRQSKATRLKLIGGVLSILVTAVVGPIVVELVKGILEPKPTPRLQAEDFRVVEIRPTRPQRKDIANATPEGTLSVIDVTLSNSGDRRSVV